MATATAAPGQRAPAVAGRLADYVVLAHAPDVPLIAADYWQLSAGCYRQVDAFTRAAAAADGQAAAAYLALRRSPGDPGAHRAFGLALERLLTASPWLAGTASDLIAGADARIWIDYRLGPSYSPAARDAGLDLIAALPLPRRAAGPPGQARASVLIPFRDTRRGARLRNLIACLRALRDQDPVTGLTVTVIETDTVPRCRDLIEPLADRYLFGYKDGLFNKSWAVNVGLRAAGPPWQSGTPQLTCVLDADILVDRQFAARNLARFDDLCHGAHLPFWWSLSLDGPSTSEAIWQRIGAEAGEVDAGALRGLRLRECPGGCLWARTGLLHRIGGFDERYEGWGGEDDDVIGRLGGVTSLARFDDLILHLDHPRPPALRPDGTGLNAHLAGSYLGEDAWTGAAGFGDPGRFLAAAGGGPAGRP